MGKLAQMVGVLATVAMIALSASMNYEFAYSLGTTPRNAMILGALSVAADLLKAVAPILIAAAWAARAYGRATLGAALFVLTLLLGFVSAIGFGSENRGGLASSRENLNAALSDALRDETEARRRLTALPQHRPQAAIAGELAALKKDRAWDTSKACTEATTQTSRDLCKAVERLNAESGTAAEAAVLSQKLERLALDVARLRERGAGGDADPQATAIRRLMLRVVGDVDAVGVRSALSLLLALTVEGFSAFGLYVCGVGHDGGKRRPIEPGTITVSEVITPQPSNPQPASVGAAVSPVLAIEAKAALTVDDFMMARFDFDRDGAGVPLAEVYADYCGEAKRQGLSQFSEAEFAASWRACCAELKIDEVNGRFVGVRLGVQADG